MGMAPDLALPAAWQPHFLRRYDPDPRGAFAAREAVSRYYADRGTTVDPADVILTAGTSEAYAQVFRLLSDSGDRVLVPRPGYPLIDPIAEAVSIGVTDYRLDRRLPEGRWTFDPHQLPGGARAVVIVQPGHPTGALLDEPAIQNLDAAAASAKLAVVSDEVFSDFRWDDVDGGVRSALGDRQALTFVLSGASKVCGLPQMKIGWIALAGPLVLRGEARQRLEWLSDLFLTVSTPAQLALPEWLADRHVWQRRVRERIATNLVRVNEALARHSSVESFSDRAGWVVALRLPGGRNETMWPFDLLQRDVIVHPGYLYDFDEDPIIVVSLIVEPSSFTQGIDRLEELLLAAE